MILARASLFLVTLPLGAQDSRPFGRQPDGTVLVPTQQAIDPAGPSVEFPGRPTDLALLDKGRVLAIKNRTDLVLLSWKDQVIRQTLAVPQEGLSYHGIAVSADGKQIYVTGSHDRLWIASYEQDVANWIDPIKLPGPMGKGNSAPGGIALHGDELLVTLSRNNALGIVDFAQKQLVHQIAVGIAPYDVVVDGDIAWVSNWGGHAPGTDDDDDDSSGTKVRVDKETSVANSGTVSVVDLAKHEEIVQIDVGLHPSGMALDTESHRLYVSNANSDTISVIDTVAHKVVQTMSARPRPDLPFGSSPNAVALGKGGKTLFVALGTNNAILALDAQSGSVLGALPVGWYPGALLFDARREWLYVANTKGVGSLHVPTDKHGFNSHQHQGSVTMLHDLSARSLAAGLTLLANNNRWSHLDAFLLPPRPGTAPVPVPERHGEPSVFEHVVYVLKENRTYDQVLGDMKKGNGDSSLCTFGQQVTPNQHALADEFVLLDNFHCSGVLSADGHQWTDEAFVTDYIEKSFGGFARSYPFDGDDPLAYASTGFLWDNALRHQRTFRCYGEMVQATITPTGTWQELWDDHVHGTHRYKITARSTIDAVEKNLCKTFIGFPNTVTDQYRADEFLQELRRFEQSGKFPSLVVMLLPNDHTAGTRPHLPTPRAMVADNDLALGRIVEALTKSRFWPRLCIFVVEDDPQAGWDHVDAHRTIAQVISPYTKRGATVSTRYTQIDMVKTIELLLGLPPMNQLDLCGVPMRECFTEQPDPKTFAALKSSIPLDQLNAALDKLSGPALKDALASLKLDLDELDKADEDTLNRILWHSVKGHDVPYPDKR